MGDRRRQLAFDRADQPQPSMDYVPTRLNSLLNLADHLMTDADDAIRVALQVKLFN